MLGDFFRINMPYGMMKNDNDEWAFFNREYVPIGYNDRDSKYNLSNQHDIPVWTKYKALTEKKLLSFSHGGKGGGIGEGVERDSNGKICKVWFYHDGTNPANYTKQKNTETTIVWNRYFEVIKELSKLIQEKD